LESIGKNAVVAYQENILVCVEELRKTRKTAVGISSTTADTGNKELLNTSPVHYRSISLRGESEKIRQMYFPSETKAAHGLKFMAR
jgi:hypothetical protein